MSSYSNTVYILAKRLWQTSCLRAAGVSKANLASSITLLVAAAKSVDPKRDRDEIASCLYEHIRDYATHFLMTPFCITCQKAGECSPDMQSCADYIRDPMAYHAGVEQLYKGIALLNGVYGFDSSSFVAEMAQLLQHTPPH